MRLPFGALLFQSEYNKEPRRVKVYAVHISLSIGIVHMGACQSRDIRRLIAIGKLLGLICPVLISILHESSVASWNVGWVMESHY